MPVEDGEVKLSTRAFTSKLSTHTQEVGTVQFLPSTENQHRKLQVNAWTDHPQGDAHLRIQRCKRFVIYKLKLSI